MNQETIDRDQEEQIRELRQSKHEEQESEEVHDPVIKDLDDIQQGKSSRELDHAVYNSFKSFDNELNEDTLNDLLSSIKQEIPSVELDDLYNHLQRMEEDGKLSFKITLSFNKDKIGVVDEQQEDEHEVFKKDVIKDYMRSLSYKPKRSYRRKFDLGDSYGSL